MYYCIWFHFLSIPVLNFSWHDNPELFRMQFDSIVTNVSQHLIHDDVI